jgi:hypothetical protein
MCNQTYKMKIKDRTYHIKCGSRDHWGAIGFVCGCASWPTGDGSDSNDCDGKKCCNNKKE